ncbi:MAG: hypothetical protein LC623_08205 [Halobacteriales archaeon]|nr:hypothetical protein [Halobacteriales archaeon]
MSNLIVGALVAVLLLYAVDGIIQKQAAKAKTACDDIYTDAVDIASCKDSADLKQTITEVGLLVLLLASFGLYTFAKRNRKGAGG